MSTNLKELLVQQQYLQDEIARLEETIKPQMDILQVDLQTVKEQINQIALESAAKAYREAKKDTGTVHFAKDGVQVKVVIDKKVEWDQRLLKGIWDRIKSFGDKPEQYITLKESLTVAEKAFTAWPEQIKNLFIPARTIISRPPKFEYTIEEVQG